MKTNLGNTSADLPANFTSGNTVLEIVKNNVERNQISKSMNLINMTGKQASKVSIPFMGKLDVNLAGTVKNVGHFFGFKFAPWGAVNIVEGAAKVLGWIGIAYTAWQFFDKVSNAGNKEREAKEALRNAKNDVRQQFSQAAEDMRQQMLDTALGKIDELIAPILQEADKKLVEFKNKKEQFKVLNRELQVILKDVDTLMEAVQGTAGSR